MNMAAIQPLLRPALLVICSLGTLSAFADERILDFHSDITVFQDGNMHVVETIRVRAENQNIRRGIFRDFPTDYRDFLGNRVRVGFDLLDVHRDGRIEARHMEPLANGVRIYAGSSGVFLPPGVYEYQFKYRVSRMLGYFAGHDELFWNVTGNGWAFPIDRVSAKIKLPDSVRAEDIQIEGYTGPYGSRGQNYTAAVDFDARATIESNQPLGPFEGLTVVVSWPKGHVHEPTFAENMAFLLRQNMGLLTALSAGLGALLYLFLAWHRVGRDPPPGAIFPHYEAPEGFSPASIRYISRMGYDKTALTAAVLNLAVNGYLEIENRGDAYTLRATGKEPDEKLAPGEAVLYSKLFSDGYSVQLDNENHAILRRAMAAHKVTLDRYHRHRHFVTNGKFLAPAIVLLVGALIAVIILNELSAAVIITVVASAIAVAVFAWLLKAPTLLGRKLLDRVEGFRMYLELAEKEDLDLRNPPEKTPELFEVFLPYALALGVEQPWAEQFEEVFRRIRDQQGSDYRPQWFAGRWHASNPVKMASVVGSSLNAAISSAATPPGSSSGSGGGGFSGGGGGGGGGGGW